VAERRSVAPDVAGSKPASRPKRTSYALDGNTESLIGFAIFSSMRPNSALPPAAPIHSLKNSSWLTEFVPRRGMRNPDIQTLLANFLPRKIQLPAPENIVVQVDAASNSRVLCHCNWQPESVRSARMTMLLLHGLEGSSQSQYMLGNADKAWRAGWNVIRMNMRNCGGTEMLSPTLYHSGLSGDVQAVSEFFAVQYGVQQMAWVGYSMGGNMVLKAAGEYGSSAPAWLRAVVGVSPVIDMQPSADALHDLRNRIYELNFLKNMLGRYRRKAKLFPGKFSLANCRRVRSIRMYDEYIVAPNCGFAGADDYYHQAASASVIDRIAVPTLILHALDDPFIRLLPETRAKILNNPNITLVETKHGGHCGFLAPIHPLLTSDGYWAESTLMAFIDAAEQQAQPNERR
jgi:predicted alpha/beta-fold hydrolase